MQNKVKTPNLTFVYSFIQGFYWMNFSAVMGFASLYLLDSGFTNTEIGMIMAVAGIISAVLQPMIAGYADKPSSPSLKKIILVLIFIQFGLGILMLCFFHKAFLLTGVLYASTITLLQLLTPFVNALGMQTIGITGQKGGAMAALCDVNLPLPAQETYQVQELTLPVYHALCAMAEAAFFEQ